MDKTTPTAQKILKCLEDVALEKGLDALSMRDVARRANISLASLQYHYPSKDKLIDAFVHDIVSQLQAGIEEILALEQTTPKLPLIVQYLVDEALQGKESSVLLMIWARALHNQTTEEALKEFFQSYQRGVQTLVQVDYPTISQPQAATAATLIVSMIEGLGTTLSITDQSTLDQRALIQTAVHFTTEIPQKLIESGMS